MKTEKTAIVKAFEQGMIFRVDELPELAKEIVKIVKIVKAAKAKAIEQTPNLFVYAVNHNTAPAKEEYKQMVFNF